MEPTVPAGSAKKPTPRNATTDPNIFPAVVTGYTSPYPT